MAGNDLSRVTRFPLQRRMCDHAYFFARPTRAVALVVGRNIFLAALCLTILTPAAVADDTKFRDAERTIEALDFLAKNPEKGCELKIYDCKSGWEERLAECQAARRLEDEMHGLALIGKDEVCARWQTGEPPCANQTKNSGDEGCRDASGRAGAASRPT
jgi:hypothetical protein